jgi:hypothetical protein
MKKKEPLLKLSEKSITFTLQGIGIVRFSIVEPGLDIISGFDVLKLKHGIKVDFAYNLKENSFQVIMTIVYHYELKENIIQLLELVFMTNFQILELSKHIEIDGNNFKIPNDLLVNFVSIVYSTARGILYAKTQGSFLNQFILPLIDPKVIIEQRLKQMAEIANTQ